PSARSPFGCSGTDLRLPTSRRVEAAMFFRSSHPSENDLSAYVDNQLDTANTRRVAAHLEGCSQCRETIAGLRGTKATLGALPRYEALRSFALSASQAGLQTRPTPSRPSALRFAPAMALAVLAILVVVDIATPNTTTTVSTANH